MDIIDRRAETVSDSNIDDHENRVQQYGNAVLAMEKHTNKLNKLNKMNKLYVDSVESDDVTVVNEFRALFRWDLFHTALFTSIYQVRN